MSFAIENKPICSMCPMRRECASVDPDIFVASGCPLWDEGTRNRLRIIQPLKKSSGVRIAKPRA